MPEFVIKFKLPQENSELDYCQNGKQYYLCLWDIFDWIVMKKETGYNKISIDEIRKEFFDILKDRGIDLE